MNTRYCMNFERNGSENGTLTRQHYTYRKDLHTFNLYSDLPYLSFHYSFCLPCLKIYEDFFDRFNTLLRVYALINLNDACKFGF